MLIFVFGTTGELIKIAPLIHWARDIGAPMQLWCTGQQLDELPEALDALDLPAPDRWLAKGWSGHSLRTKSDLGKWMAKLMFDLVRLRSRLAKEIRSGGAPLVLVHGDTITTPIGAVLGRMLRVDVAHVEAGLRSGTWRSPFPEELDRRFTTKLATVHFAPGDEAVANLRAAKAKGHIVDTELNTVFDALNMVKHLPPSHGLQLPDRYGLVSIHRGELIEDAANLETILRIVAEASHRTPMVFVDHPITQEAITRHGHDHLLADADVVRVPKQRYAAFIQLVVNSEFVMTDSGGLQEECGYLGHPCLIHRDVTERSVGLGRSVVLSRGDLDVVRDFLTDPSRYRCEGTPEDQSPTKAIGDWLIEHKYAPSA